MTPARAKKIQAVLAMRQPDLTLIADAVHKGRNLAAIIRSCDAVGIAEVHAVMSADEFKPFSGTAMGSDQWVDVCLHPSIEKAIETVKQQGMQLIVADIGDEESVLGAKPSSVYHAIDFTQPTALLMGSEKRGVSDISRQQADALVHIPMKGMVESYNVSVAAAIMLNEACRQRSKAGLYATRRIDDACYQQLFFRWAYPRLATFCDRRAIPYPMLKGNGDIDDPLGEWRAQAKTHEVLKPIG